LGLVDYRGGGECFFLEMELAALKHPFPAKKFPHHPALFGEVDIALLTGFKKKSQLKKLLTTVKVDELMFTVDTKKSGFAGVRFRDHRLLQIMVAE
jgi:hypothetical protein